MNELLERLFKAAATGSNYKTLIENLLNTLWSSSTINQRVQLMHSSAVEAIFDEGNIEDIDRRNLIQQAGVFIDGECLQYPKADWRYEVQCHYTLLGYWDWVLSTAQADRIEPDQLTFSSSGT